MEHQQARHEKHEKERKERQAEERQSEEQFSRPGPTIRPLWLLILGVILCLVALVIWMKMWAGIF